MRKITAIFAFILLFVTASAFAQPLLVWPGDATNNGVVNIADFLRVGLLRDSAGPARDTVFTGWAGQVLATPWGSTPTIFQDLGYGDCDGSGRVDSLDFDVVRLNYGRIWQAFPGYDTSFLVSAAAPPLALSLPDSAYISTSDTILLSMSLGDGANAVDRLYCLGFVIEFDPTIVDDVLLFDFGGWINPDGKVDALETVDTVAGRVELGITRLDGFPVNGNGYIGSLGIVIDDDIRVSADYILPFRITFAQAFDSVGRGMLLRGVDDTLRVALPDRPAKPGPPLPLFQVSPTPADDALTLQSSGLHGVAFRVYDVRGVEVMRQQMDHLTRHTLDVQTWAPGIYLLDLTSVEGRFRAKLVVGGH
jgi:hypothetical protein